MARKNPKGRKTRRGTPGGRGVGMHDGAMGPGQSKRRRRSTSAPARTRKNPAKRRRYRRNPDSAPSSTGFTSKLFFTDLMEDVIPGFVGFAATRFLTRIAAVQIEKRKPGLGKHTGAIASVGSFLAAWLLAGRVKSISKWHQPLVVGAGLAALQSILQLYVPKLGWMVGDPSPELLGNATANAAALAQRQQQQIPPGLQEINEDPSLYTYDDRYDAGRFAANPGPAAPSTQANGQPAPTSQQNPDLEDLEGSDLGIFSGVN